MADQIRTPRGVTKDAFLDMVRAGTHDAIVELMRAGSDNPGADLVKVAIEANIEWIVLGPHRAVFGTDYRGGVAQDVLDRARVLPINVAVAVQAGEAEIGRAHV